MSVDAVVAEDGQRVLLGPPRPQRLGEYLTHGGFAPGVRGDELIDEIEAAGLRGRGGAAFLASIKWQAVAAQAGPRHVLVNGEEGEPASLKDRWLLANRPLLILEGALLAANAVGASTVWVYVADARAGACVERAVAELQHGGILGHGVHEDATVHVVSVPHTYVAGEETSAVRSINGGPALPTTKPPRPFESGIGGQPTLVHNVETLAQAALIARWGATWFRQVGPPGSPGTFLLSLDGDCNAPGLYELRLGIPLDEALAQCGGVSNGQPIGFVMGGYFAGTLGRRGLGLQLDYDTMRSEGSGLGCGAVTVIGPDRCPVAVTTDLVDFHRAQSAGQCGVCVRGTSAMADILLSTARGDDLGRLTTDLPRYAEMVRGRGACALPDAASAAVTSLFREFPDVVDAHASQPCPTCREGPTGLVRQLPAPLDAPG